MTPTPRVAPLRALGGVLAVLSVLLAVCLSPLWIWSVASGPGAGQPFVAQIHENATPAELSELLAARGALHSPRLFRAYLAILQPGFELAAGEHLLNDAASPRQLAQRLARSSGRPAEHVTFPEGFQSFQVGQRLERAEVCSLSAFRRAVTDPTLLRELGIEGTSAEGYLFPASYGLLVDSDAREIVRVLSTEGKKRMQKLIVAHPGRFEQLTKEFGFRERDVLTLASMIEKEAQASDERPLIASVFFNRLRDPEFRPARMLQSDPTAGYGCLVASAEIPSCAGFHGSVTPALLRDAANPYNTYRHAGLPPGPIANPGEASILAVLAPAQSDFLYFVAKGAGRHNFSRTFAEHRQALESPH
ncbi:MAG TPA: endolytic transglycosylase MltG [Polyangiaceae bacterium]|nr:endolytic transglycosylase MltG [Polyangiaceae bacterium]